MCRNLDEVIRASTQNPAEIIGLEDKIGTLREGCIADIGVFELQEGKYLFNDCFGEKMEGTVKLIPALTIMDGQICR